MYNIIRVYIGTYMCVYIKQIYINHIYKAHKALRYMYIKYIFEGYASLKTDFNWFTYRQKF